MAGFPKGKNRLGETAKQPRAGIPLDRSVIKELILKHNGNLSMVADRMGTNRHTVRNHCDADPELQKALEDARERRLDDLENATWQDAVERPDPAMRCFLLKTIGRHRGYEQDDNKNAAKDIARAAFDFILDKSKQPSS